MTLEKQNMGMKRLTTVCCWMAVSWVPQVSLLFAADKSNTFEVSSDVLDLTLEPAHINTSPGEEYSDDARDFAMVRGFDRTPNGRIWAAWIGGGDDDTAFFVTATSDDDGATWSKPRLVIDPTDSPTGLKRRSRVGNFWTDPLGRLWLFYDQNMGGFDGRAGLWTITCDNPDADEPRWSTPRRLWHGGAVNKPLVLKSGEWLLPVTLWTRNKIGPAQLRSAFRELDDLRMAHVFVSTDKGKNWKRRGGVRFPDSSFDEHMVVELNDGRLWMLSRTTYGIGESFSSNAGRSWSDPVPAAIMHTSSRFFIRRLASGRLLLVKHGRINERTPKRSHLTAFLSDNDGASWRGGLVLDEREGVSYPDGFQAPDGTIYIIYDFNRSTDAEILFARFNEQDVLAGEFKSDTASPRLLINKARGRKDNRDK